MKNFFRRAAAAALSAVVMLTAAGAVLPQISGTTITAEAASELTLSKTTVSLGKTERIKLTANQSVKWRTSAPKILTVDQNGLVQGVGTGTAWITARNSAGKEKSCKITVKNAPPRVSISKTALTLGVGESFTLSASVPDGSAAANRTFRTSNSSIVKMTKTNWTGSFKAVKPGTAWVTVRTFNGKEASCKITVKKAPTWVTVDKKQLNMKVGESASVNAVIAKDAGCATRTYRTSNSSIVKITKTNWTGGFKAVKAGTAWVTVRLYNGKEASCKIIVSDIPAAAVKLNRTSADMKVGGTLTLSATVSPSNATNKSITWSSSNTGVAAVSAGKVKAVGAGTAKIIAKTSNGKQAYCTVKVKAVTGFTKLEDKMAVKGDEIDENGNSVVTGGTLDMEELSDLMTKALNGDESALENFSGGTEVMIGYAKEEDKISFAYLELTPGFKNSSMVGFEADFNNTYVIKPMYQLIGTGDEDIPLVMMESQVNAKNYKRGMQLPFVLGEGMEYYNIPVTMEQSAHQQASEKLGVAMQEWDKLLYAKYGMHMKDIGFDKF